MSSLEPELQGRSRPAEWPVRSGPLPSAAGLYFPRFETWPSLPQGLPIGQAIVLAPGDGAVTSSLGELGGSGKTMLAAALAADHADRGLADLVLWIDASSRDAILSAYAGALRDVAGPGQRHPAGREAEHAAADFLTWLSRTERPWLIVLDDLRGMTALDGYWPSGPTGRVLITTERSENAAAVPFSRLAPVGIFSPREAISFLSARVQDDPDRRLGAIDLATELGFLPVALGHAGACMTATGMGCRQYHTWYTECRMRLDGSVPDGHASIVAATLAVSAELTDRFGPAGLAGPALALLSVLSPHGIPAAVLTSEAARRFLAGPGSDEPLDPALARGAVGNLARTGLVSIDLAGPAGTVLVHPAIQAAVWRNLPAPARERATRTAADALVQAWPEDEEPAELARALRRCSAALRQISGAGQWAPEFRPLLVRTGRSLTRVGMPDLAARHWEAMLEAGQGGAGAPRAQAFEIRDLLGASYETAGRVEQAVGIYQNALAEGERALGSYHPEVLAARVNLSRAYSAAGRAEDAILLAEEAVRDCEFALGSGQPGTLAARVDLARAYLSAGRFPDGVTELTLVLDGRARVLGHDHPDYLAACAELAAVYQAAGEFDEAIALRRRALADIERVLGSRHANTITARAALAEALRLAGKTREAIRLNERTLADLEQKLGPGHPDTIDGRGELALAYQAAGKLTYAIRQLERALADAERAFGPDHPRTQAARSNLRGAAVHARALRGIDLRSPR